MLSLSTSHITQLNLLELAANYCGTLGIKTNWSLLPIIVARLVCEPMNYLQIDYIIIGDAATQMTSCGITNYLKHLEQ